MEAKDRGTTMSAEWIPVIQKVTEEEDNMPFKDGNKPRLVKTTRTWYVNKNAPTGILSKIDLKELPEN